MLPSARWNRKDSGTPRRGCHPPSTPAAPAPLPASGRLRPESRRRTPAVTWDEGCPQPPRALPGARPRGPWLLSAVTVCPSPCFIQICVSRQRTWIHAVIPLLPPWTMKVLNLVLHFLLFLKDTLAVLSHLVIFQVVAHELFGYLFHILPGTD